MKNLWQHFRNWYCNQQSINFFLFTKITPLVRQSVAENSTEEKGSYNVLYEVFNIL